jgi:hypothetical protein
MSGSVTCSSTGVSWKEPAQQVCDAAVRPADVTYRHCKPCLELDSCCCVQQEGQGGIRGKGGYWRALQLCPVRSPPPPRPCPGEGAVVVVVVVAVDGDCECPGPLSTWCRHAMWAYRKMSNTTAIIFPAVWWATSAPVLSICQLEKHNTSVHVSIGWCTQRERPPPTPRLTGWHGP